MKIEVLRVGLWKKYSVRPTVSTEKCFSKPKHFEPTELTPPPILRFSMEERHWKILMITKCSFYTSGLTISHTTSTFSPIFRNFWNVLFKLVKFTWKLAREFAVPATSYPPLLCTFSLISYTKFSAAVATKYVTFWFYSSRGCYFNFERNLTFFKHYTQQNCYMDCVTSELIKHCNCSTFYLPRFEYIDVCTLQNNSCVKAIYTQLQRAVFLKKDQCDCLPGCTIISYDFETHYSPIRNSTKDV